MGTLILTGQTAGERVTTKNEAANTAAF